MGQHVPPAPQAPASGTSELDTSARASQVPLLNDLSPIGQIQNTMILQRERVLRKAKWTLKLR
ncbi:hypothetical protein N7447_008614 [Penicillium robsamsonii]|uniref:uncharacterized protein n=1 Tax=Penicillium robsamsonii TaxID=1792511 RepID=UPI0025465968|nr:uncharacterized protein N7447_008614 [Penicillium robsamsonii]KAJ5816381.1 hypothetical protein N7447_008614 [Penicillium robsamsonii]